MVTVGWVTLEDVQVVLRVPVTDPSDVAWLESATAAANDLAFRRRSYWYEDDPAVAPDAAVHHGTAMLGARLYSLRSTLTGYAQYADYTPAQVVGLWPDIGSMLGTPRAAVF